MEGYLLYVSALTRFRMSSYRLALQTGRHSKPKIAKEESKCRNCSLDEVEDEKHFLLKCQLLSGDCYLLIFHPMVLNSSAMSQDEKFRLSSQ